MMRSRFLVRLLAVVLVGLVLAAPGSPTSAAPSSPQQLVTVGAYAYVDVTGPCNLVFDPEDVTFARATPLPSVEFILLDSSGTEVARQSTTALNEVQRARFENLASLSSYTVKLAAAPAGWAHCPNEPAEQTASVVLGLGRADFHFYIAGDVTPPPGDTPTATPVPPTAPPVETTVTVPPVTTTEVPATVPATQPPSGGEEEEEEEEAAPGQPVSVSAQAGAAGTGTGVAGAAATTGGVAYVNPPRGTGEHAMIKGLVYVDENGDGVFGAGEPGLNDVQVYLHGGGLAISQITPASGAFSFEALGAGEYDVYITPGSEWTITSPWKYVVKVRGNIVTGIDFGMSRHGVAAMHAVDEHAGTGIRLPATGVIDMPRGALFGSLALALSILGLVGLTAERWRNRRREF